MHPEQQGSEEARSRACSVVQALQGGTEAQALDGDPGLCPIPASILLK